MFISSLCLLTLQDPRISPHSPQLSRIPTWQYGRVSDRQHLLNNNKRRGGEKRGRHAWMCVGFLCLCFRSQCVSQTAAQQHTTHQLTTQALSPSPNRQRIVTVFVGVTLTRRQLGGFYLPQPQSAHRSIPAIHSYCLSNRVPRRRHADFSDGLSSEFLVPVSAVRRFHTYASASPSHAVPSHFTS